MVRISQYICLAALRRDKATIRLRTYAACHLFHRPTNLAEALLAVGITFGASLRAQRHTDRVSKRNSVSGPSPKTENYTMHRVNYLHFLGDGSC